MAKDGSVVAVDRSQVEDFSDCWYGGFWAPAAACRRDDEVPKECTAFAVSSVSEWRNLVLLGWRVCLVVGWRAFFPAGWGGVLGKWVSATAMAAERGWTRVDVGWRGAGEPIPDSPRASVPTRS